MAQAIQQGQHQQLYEVDYALWVDEAVALLRQQRFDELDLEHLIEEVADLGRGEKNALKSNLRVLLIHLLKWQYQANKRSSSWRATITEHRARLLDGFEDSPSLQRFYREQLPLRYRLARKYAADETGMDVSFFPESCLYSPDEVLDTQFWPEP